jgi:hypothetical protein
MSRIPCRDRHVAASAPARLRRGRAWWLALLALVSAAALAHAGEERTLDHYSPDDGLSQNTVTALVDDDQGFLWVGTQDGLNRFDGHRFQVFRPPPTDETTRAESIRNGSVERLAYDPLQRRLWVANNGAGWNASTWPTGAAGSSTTAATSAATASNGCWPRPTAAHGSAPAPAWTASPAMRCGHARWARRASWWACSCRPGKDAAGAGCRLRTLVGRRHRLAAQAAGPARRHALRLRPTHGRRPVGDRERRQRIPHRAGRPAPADDRPAMLHLGQAHVTAVSRSDEATLLLGYSDGRLMQLPGDGGAPAEIPLAPGTGSAIISLHADRSGTLWIGTASNGLFRMRMPSPSIDHGWLPASALALLGTRSVHAIWQAADGRPALVGTDQGLLEKASASAPWRTVPALVGPSVRAIAPAADGDGWWIGTQSGLFRSAATTACAPAWPGPGCAWTPCSPKARTCGSAAAAHWCGCMTACASMPSACACSTGTG